MRHPKAGLTIVELLIAIALMMVLTAQVVFVFNQSRQVFSSSLAMVDVYQNARIALDQMERDCQNAVKTADMEPFNDNITAALGVGRYDPGEEVPDLKGRYFGNQVPYVYAMAMKQPKEYAVTTPGPLEGRTFRWDSLYLKTLALVRGESKEAIVQYDLYIRDPATPKERPVLRRTVTEVTAIDATTRRVTVERHDPEDVCYYVQEFKIEPYLRDLRTLGVGRFYSPKECVQGGQPPLDDPEPPLLPRFGTGDTYGLMCASLGGYRESTALSDPPHRAYISKDGYMYTDLNPSNPMAKFPQLAPGDRIYMNPTDPTLIRKFPSAVLTVSRIVVGGAGAPGGPAVRVEFREDADLRSKFTPTANLGNAVEVNYRAGWLPSAMRATLKIKDARTTEVRTIQRIFKLLRG